MTKLIPVPDALSKPFCDAVNQRRLMLQHCAACDRLQWHRQLVVDAIATGALG
jgi:Rubredoxin-like zinc ribbon domain (DUF35_N)